MLKLKVIACDVLNREISYLASQSKHYVDVTFLYQGLHNTPNYLKEMLQKEVDKANGEFPYNYNNTCPSYDYIIIAYGLCSNGVVGVKSSRIPMIIPKAHDCITLLMGSKEMYKRNFDKNPGTYWFSSGWIERGWQPSEQRYNALLNDYTEKYGEDNAEYLMEMEQNWLNVYKKAGLITWSSFSNNEYYRGFTEDSAKFLKWDYLELEGNENLLKNILNGQFNENEVLIVPPNQTVEASYDEQIIKLA